MEPLLLIVAVVAIVAGTAGVILPLLPGTPLVFAGLWLLAWLDGYVRVGGVTVVVLGMLAALAWFVDYLASAFGVKRVGASGLAVTGALVGAVLGILGGFIGVVVGPIIGATAGELIARRSHGQAARAGLAAGLGFVIAIIAKLGLTFAMLGIFALAWLV